jgi:hypothetical protein
MFDPMTVSGVAALLSGLSFLRKLSQEAGLHVLSVGGGITALAGAFGDSIEDFMGNLLVLLVLATFGTSLAISSWLACRVLGMMVVGVPALAVPAVPSCPQWCPRPSHLHKEGRLHRQVICLLLLLRV